MRIFETKCQIFPLFLSNLGKGFTVFNRIWEKVGQIGTKSDKVKNSRKTKQGLRQKQKHSQTETMCTLACFFLRLLAACTSCTASRYGSLQLQLRQRLGRRLQCVWGVISIAHIRMQHRLSNSTLRFVSLAGRWRCAGGAWRTLALKGTRSCGSTSFCRASEALFGQIRLLLPPPPHTHTSFSMFPMRRCLSRRVPESRPLHHDLFSPPTHQ
jgi:hypothetical protein